MKIAIRVDASISIGLGHLMRCITLANEFRNLNAQVCFICRSHTRHTTERIIQEGYQLSILPSGIKEENNKLGAQEEPPGRYWEIDLVQTKAVLNKQQFDWLIVDHYELGHFWETGMRQLTKRIMVIDDLADRKHDCDLLLDQTYNRNKKEYINKTPKECKLLTGSQFALIRPEFKSLRKYSLNRRNKIKIENLLISLGGVDNTNATSEVLKALRESSLPDSCRITILMGADAPWLNVVRKIAGEIPWPTKIEVDSDNVAKLMADSDLSIGAAGSSAWERCCLGLPTIMVVLADNQNDIARGLDAAQAVIQINKISELNDSINMLIKQPEMLENLSSKASTITDGNGVKMVSKMMMEVCA